MRKAFTLIELSIVFVLIGLMLTFAVPIYHNIMEKANEKACQVNLSVILEALDIYGLENDRMPGSLAQLLPEHFEKAWAKVLHQGGGWKIKLTYCLIDFNNRGLVYAEDKWIANYVKDLKYLSCPSDSRHSGQSYGINSSLTTLSYRDYKALSDNTAVIADSSGPTFPPFAQRHKAYNLLNVTPYAIAITKNKTYKHDKDVTNDPHGYGKP